MAWALNHLLIITETLIIDGTKMDKQVDLKRAERIYPYQDKMGTENCWTEREMLFTLSMYS